MLHVLIFLQRTLPFKFDLGSCACLWHACGHFSTGVCTIDPQTEAYDPSPLKKYVESLGLPYFYESQSIIDDAKQVCPTSICSWCARMKRGALYTAARRERYNVLVLAQHLGARPPLTRPWLHP